MRHQKLLIYIVVVVAATLSSVSTAQVPLIEGPVVTPQPNSEITANRRRALDIFRRLTGVVVPIDDPRLAQMEERLNQSDAIGAARIATQDPGFLNFVVRDFAAKMSAREETVSTVLNDFTATLIGMVRDDVSAKEMLTANYYYQADANLSTARSDLMADIISSNNHYADLQTQGSDLKASLIRVDGQKLQTAANGIVNNPDAAGLITTRAFLEAHASAGTNRRLVEFTFREFLCTPIQVWADGSTSDFRVGRDVDRYPGGSNAKYRSNCQTCHANMDAMRGAFAQVDFRDNVIKHTLFANTPQNPTGVASKFNQNTNVFPGGYTTTDASWINQAVAGANADRFGWRGEVMGVGIQQFGQMVANAKGFSRCMVRRVFQSVCLRDPATFENSAIETLTNEFEAGGYKLKDLFERIAVRPECMGNRGGN